MAYILGITFPIYAVIAIGYAVVKIGWFRRQDMKVLGDFVLQVAMPALLFITVASRDVAHSIRPDYMLVYLVGSLATIIVAYLWFSMTAPDAGRRAVAVMGSSCPNNGFIGYPVMLLAYPDIAGIVLGMNFLIENIILIPICLILLDLSQGPVHHSIPRRIGLILWGVLKRPMIIGLLLGLAVSIAGIPLPDATARLFTLLANSAAALSLIVIGGSLVGLPLGGNQRMAAQIATAKLVMHPVLTGLAVAAFAALGMVSLSPDLFAAVILSSAMPMFGIYTVLAQERGLEGMASIAMLVTTSVAFITISAILYWLV
ncbi:AEC family transporter [Phaeobacter marinintestinus]|uniref:AEC family transporter n=1 Tax=Falsiphaeobacter marinintestinus TaxID=1492905 RepID=UPI0011B53812|nr:AEC family transporter [Phaeobacter marinintestinus]